MTMQAERELEAPPPGGAVRIATTLLGACIALAGIAWGADLYRAAGWNFLAEQFLAVNPSGRAGKPEEVAAVVTFLLSDGSTFVNGTVLPIDGGQSAKY